MLNNLISVNKTLIICKKNRYKTQIHRKLILNQEDIDKIIKLAENKTTSEMPWRKLAVIMNKHFEEAGKNIRISRTTVAKYLKNHFYTNKNEKSFYNKW